MGVVYNFLYAPLDAHILSLETFYEVGDPVLDLGF